MLLDWSRIAYRVALAVAAGQHFSVSGAVSQFVIAVFRGVAVGCIVGLAAIAIHKRLDEPLIETVVTLLTPFAAYLARESLNLSGVLAVVCAGLMVGQKASYLFSAATRLHATAVWDCVVFVLTGLTFIFIGLQMREVVTIIAIEEQRVWNSFCAVLILVVTIAVRMIWVFPAAWIPKSVWHRSVDFATRTGRTTCSFGGCKSVSRSTQVPGSSLSGDRLFAIPFSGAGGQLADATRLGRRIHFRKSIWSLPQGIHRRSYSPAASIA